jgi:hypothetical protein
LWALGAIVDTEKLEIVHGAIIVVKELAVRRRHKNVERVVIAGGKRRKIGEGDKVFMPLETSSVISSARTTLTRFFCPPFCFFYNLFLELLFGLAKNNLW